jgi:phenylalanine-4-hydroxylase
MNKNDELIFIKTSGPSALSYQNKQLAGHGKDYHAAGFSSPVGRLKDSSKPFEDYSSAELDSIGITIGKIASLTFESGVVVNGKVESMISKGDKLLLITFVDCTVKEANGNILFKPEWGNYDMAVGEEIISVFNGAADKDAYEEIVFVSGEQTHKVAYDDATKNLHALYQKVREVRANGTGYEDLSAIFESLKTTYRTDWLLSLEILEVVYHKQLDAEFEKELRIYLEVKAATESEYTKLINDGLHVIANPVTQLINEED